MKIEYSPFSVALIDLFASAMMAFMMLTFIALPKITFTDNVSSSKQISKFDVPIIFDGNQWYLRKEHFGILDLIGRDLKRSAVKIKLVGHIANTRGNYNKCFQLDSFGDTQTYRDKNQFPKTKSFKKCFKDNEWSIYLSNNRAQSVKNYLVDKIKIHPDRIITMGVGHQQPIKNIELHDARQRRVVLHYLN